MTDVLSGQLGWVDGWSRTRQGWMLDALVREDAAWVRRRFPASWVLERNRVFEPSLRPYAHLPSRSFHLDIPDLSRLSPLLQPGKQLAAQVPAARHTRHALYLAQASERPALVPAILLLGELWAWVGSALDALMTPGGLALYLRQVSTDEGMAVETSGPLAKVGDSDTSLRRLCWLAQCADARVSWASVLTSAHFGDIRLRLPRASLQAWAWGVEVAVGTLVTELSAVFLQFDLPQEGCEVRLGNAVRRCPPPPTQRPGGLVSF